MSIADRAQESIFRIVALGCRHREAEAHEFADTVVPSRCAHPAHAGGSCSIDACSNCPLVREVLLAAGQRAVDHVSGGLWSKLGKARDFLSDVGSRMKAAWNEEPGAKDAPDPYAVLKLKPNATPEEIDTRYRELARKLHPDRNDSPNADEQMARLNAAYDALRAKRKDT